MVTDDARGAGLPVKKVFREFLRKEKKKRKKRVGMLHAAKETDQTRKKLLRLIASHEQSRFTALVIDKKKIPWKMRSEKHFLYNHLAERLLDAVIAANPSATERKLTLIASQRETKKHLNLQFAEYIRERVLKNHGIIMDITTEIPATERALQAADIVSWAVYQKYEKRDSQYCDLLGEKLDEVFYS